MSSQAQAPCLAMVPDSMLAAPGGVAQHHCQGQGHSPVHSKPEMSLRKDHSGYPADPGPSPVPPTSCSASLGLCVLSSKNEGDDTTSVLAFSGRCGLNCIVPKPHSFMG